MRHAIILAGILLLPLVAAQPPPLELSALWEGSAMDTEVPVEAFDAYGVALHALDTGRPMLVSMNDNSRLLVIDLTTGAVAAEVATPHAGDRDAWWTRTLNGVSVGDMDDDGATDLLVLNSGGYLTRLERDASADAPPRLGLRTHWSVFAYAPAHDPSFWQRHPWLEEQDPGDATHLAHGHAFMARPGDDGQAWAYVQSDDLPGVFAFDSGGQLRWMDDWHDGHAGPWVGSLEPGRPGTPRTALFATDAGQVVARDAATGTERWVFAVPSDVSPGGFQVAPGVSDVDGDGTAEILVVARVAVEGGDDWMQRQHAWIAQLEHDGTLAWSTQHPQGNPMVHGAVVPVDVDGDGVQDWIMLDWNTIGRKPGDFERLGPGNLFALSGADGTLLWTAPVDAPSTDHDVPVAVFGGRLAALVPHARGGMAGIATVDVTTGAHIGWTALPEGWSPTRGVVLGDLDADGLLEAVVRLARPSVTCIPKADVGCREGAIAVYRTDALGSSLVADGAHTRSTATLVTSEPVAQVPGSTRTSADLPLDTPPGDPAWPVVAAALVVVGAVLLLLRPPRQRP